MAGRIGYGIVDEQWHLPEVLIPSMLCIKPAGTKGKGVFALRRFLKNEIVERAPVLVLPDPQWRLLNRTTLQHYYYCWDSDSVAIASGYGSFYNHSDSPNARYVKHVKENVMEWMAIRDIDAGEEITIKYDCSPWFETV